MSINDPCQVQCQSMIHVKVRVSINDPCQGQSVEQWSVSECWAMIHVKVRSSSMIRGNVKVSIYDSRSQCRAMTLVKARVSISDPWEGCLMICIWVKYLSINRFIIRLCRCIYDPTKVRLSNCDLLRYTLSIIDSHREKNNNKVYV